LPVNAGAGYGNETWAHTTNGRAATNDAAVNNQDHLRFI
jgi:hypothetical protein